MNAAVIKARIGEVLAERGRSLYWLAKQTGLPYQTLWRIKDSKTNGIDYRVLEKICEALNCQPGEIIVWIPDRQAEVLPMPVKQKRRRA